MGPIKEKGGSLFDPLNKDPLSNKEVEPSLLTTLFKNTIGKLFDPTEKTTPSVSLPQKSVTKIPTSFAKETIPFEQEYYVFDKGSLQQEYYLTHFGGLCELVCNKILEEDLLGRSSSEKNLLTEIITAQGIEEESILKSHLLENYSSYDRVKAFVTSIYPDNIFSIFEQWKLVQKTANGYEVNKELLLNGLNLIPDNVTLKLEVLKKEGFKFSGHSLLVKKIKENEFIFFDPNTGEHRGLSIDDLAKLLNDQLNHWKATDLLFLDGKKYLLKLKNAQLSRVAQETLNQKGDVKMKTFSSPRQMGKTFPFIEDIVERIYKEINADKFLSKEARLAKFAEKLEKATDKTSREIFSILQVKFIEQLKKRADLAGLNIFSSSSFEVYLPDIIQAESLSEILDQKDMRFPLEIFDQLGQGAFNILIEQAPISEDVKKRSIVCNSHNDFTETLRAIKDSEFTGKLSCTICRTSILSTYTNSVLLERTKDSNGNFVLNVLIEQIGNLGHEFAYSAIKEVFPEANIYIGAPITNVTASFQTSLTMKQLEDSFKFIQDETFFEKLEERESFARPTNIEMNVLKDDNKVKFFAGKAQVTFDDQKRVVAYYNVITSLIEELSKEELKSFATKHNSLHFRESLKTTTN